MSEGNKPIASVSTGPYSAALWENSFDNGDGTERKTKSVSLRKGYYDKKEKVLKNQSITIDPAEVGCVIHLLQEMEKNVVDRRGVEPF